LAGAQRHGDIHHAVECSGLCSGAITPGKQSIIAAVVAFVARRNVDSSVRTAIAAHFLASTLRRCRGSNGCAEKCATRSADDGTPCVASNGLTGESARACTDERAGACTLLLFARCATGEGHRYEGRCDNGDPTHLFVPLL
jgi:hypothetical protein